MATMRDVKRCRLSAAVVLTAALALTRTVAQEQHSNVIYLEGFGAAVSYSLNYERIFWLPNDLHGITARVGLGHSSLRKKYYSPYRGEAFSVVLLGNYLLGRRPMKLDVGLGGMAMVAFHDGISEVIGASVMGVVGMRYQRRDGRLSIRLFFNPHLDVLDDPTLLPWGGASFGLAF